ncbi:hypothetical protein MTBSS4_420015 [Magnetospirillum sp. SS-4]|nr:hypothetical protein MTBSS4_420015 [Magnetospirillum sp. SS-4]
MFCDDGALDGDEQTAPDQGDPWRQGGEGGRRYRAGPGCRPRDSGFFRAGSRHLFADVSGPADQAGGWGCLGVAAERFSLVVPWDGNPD